MNRLVRGMVIAAVISALAGCATQKSPTGRKQMLMYNSAEMAKMGQASFEQLKKQQKISHDRAKIAYVNCVAKRITSVLPPQDWEVVLFESPEVNAFALPGGYIGVYTGLLNVAKNADQLAAVIGHEVSHVLAQHGNEKASRAQMTGAGLQLLNLGLSSAGVESAKTWTDLASAGAQFFFVLPYGRDQETEADTLGLDLMAKAGFDPAQAVTLWQNMSSISKGAPPEFLSTHPSNANRIRNLSAHQAEAQRLYHQSQNQRWSKCIKP